jgi:demethylmenaquinone methyltransferase/2-methoxy-6-polyprenyl-1,4-benzoquinol methylase
MQVRPPRPYLGRNKVLFAGVGQGIDAVEAARRGGQVTVVDISQTMLSIFQKRIENAGFKHPIRIVRGDIFTFDERGQYDMVFANFFLNVFSEPVVLELERHLAGLARPGGCVVVGDFNLPSGGRHPGCSRASTGTSRMCSSS